MIGRDRLIKARRQIRSLPDPDAAARHAQELRWAMALITAQTRQQRKPRERPRSWQARVLGIEPREWGRIRSGIDSRGTFGRIVAAFDALPPDADAIAAALDLKKPAAAMLK